MVQAMHKARVREPELAGQFHGWRRKIAPPLVMGMHDTELACEPRWQAQRGDADRRTARCICTR
jgi:hypothetical protein